MRTAAHNTVTVFDSTEQFYYSGNLISNDGGHLISSPMMNYSDIFAPANQRGRWIVYAQDSTFVYSNTDASLSFDPQKVKRHLRKIIFHKPDKFIVIDNVIRASSITGANREVRWNAHFRNQPQVTGQIVYSQVPGHIEMFSGKKFMAVNSPAYITFTTVSPDSSLTRRIGGTGFEYWVNGQNYPPSVNPDSNTFNPGKWRIEVIPYVNSDTVNLMHTGFVSDIGNPEPPAAVKIENQTTLGCDYANSVYLFGIKGDTGAVSLYASGIAGGRTVKFFVFDLKRNSVYNIFLNGNPVNTLNSDSSGMIIRTYMMPPGNNTVHFTVNSTGSGLNGNIIPDYYSLEQNYPNPFNPSTIIGYQLPVSNYTTLIIYDIAGRVIQKPVEKYQQAGRYQVHLNVSEYSSGVYFYKLTSGNFSEVKKMLLVK